MVIRAAKTAAGGASTEAVIMAAAESARLVKADTARMATVRHTLIVAGIPIAARRASVTRAIETVRILFLDIQTPADRRTSPAVTRTEGPRTPAMPLRKATRVRRLRSIKVQADTRTPATTARRSSTRSAENIGRRVAADLLIP